MDIVIVLGGHYDGSWWAMPTGHEMAKMMRIENKTRFFASFNIIDGKVPACQHEVDFDYDVKHF